MPAQAQMRTEHVAPAPSGWRVRTVRPGPHSEHEVRIAFPPGRRKRGSGKVVEILHPAGEKNPKCKVSETAKKNPGELLIFGNPSKTEAQRSARDRAARIRSARLNPQTKKPAPQARGERAPKKTLKRPRLKKRLYGRPIAVAQRARNVSDTQQAVKLYKSFHGKDPKEIAEKHISAAHRKDYAALGDLQYLKVQTPIGQTAEFHFESDGVKLASSPDGKQLYCIGGNQNLSRCIEEGSLEKDFIDLGEAIEVQYLARKIHGKFQPVSYYHEFGEVNGTRPQLMYDKLKKQIFFIGGDYWIDAKQGVSPGIEN